VVCKAQEKKQEAINGKIWGREKVRRKQKRRRKYLK
jgi:hypothetical protein